jgi:hypothetical protein
MIKNVLLTGLMMISLNGFSQLKQKSSSLTDPTLGRIVVTDLSDNVMDAGNLPVNKLIKLKLPIANAGQKDLPAGSCKVKIGLGSKLLIDPNFSINSAHLNSYFKWTSALVGGQWQITGELIAPLPADFVSIPVFFKVAGSREGNSTITANFLVSNHNTENTLSDSDPTNNTSFLQYTIKPSSKGQFTNLDVRKNGCTINVSFSTANEFNVRKYEIETSKDNINYVKIGETEARNLLYYDNNFPLTADIKAPLIYVRIKSVKHDGSQQYSEARSVSGSCEQPWVLSLYPNPVTDVKTVTITAKSGIFDGKYRVSIMDVSGKNVQVKEVELNYVTQFKYELGVLGAGQYMIQVLNTDGTQAAVLKFEKL